MISDLRDDKDFFADHPGAVPITAVQVRIDFELFPFFLGFISFPLLHVM